MASVEGLKRKLKEYKPFVQSAYVVYIQPRAPLGTSVDGEFDMVHVTDPNDPILPQICSSKRQLAGAKKALAEKRWDVLVALKDGKPAGRIWECLATEKELASGVIRVKLAPDEFLAFDLFVAREFRRSGIANSMIDFFFGLYDPETTHIKYAYGFISYENGPSIMWHHGAGFRIAQSFNYLSVGPYIKWKIPFSDMPRFGPMSRKGRHTDPSKEMFGPSFF
jgi:GNAT superfamily N-acetyltransferase